MILLDTSIWIDLFGKNQRFRLQPEQLLLITICPPILQEVLQGIKDDSVQQKIRDSLLALPLIGDPVLVDDYLVAADIYRQGRRKGLTIRSSIDCLIAAIAIRSKIPVWHNDRDFTAIAAFTDLRIYKY